MLAAANQDGAANVTTELKVTKRHLLLALKKIRPSVSKEVISLIYIVNVRKYQLRLER